MVFSSETIADWLTVPDAAECLGVPVSTVRSMIRDRRLVGVPVNGVLALPAEFIHPSAEGDGTPPGLHGTIVLLADLGLDDADIIDWLFSVDTALAQRPVDALWNGRKHAVRRAAQLIG